MSHETAPGQRHSNSLVGFATVSFISLLVLSQLKEPAHERRRDSSNTGGGLAPIPGVVEVPSLDVSSARVPILKGDSSVLPIDISSIFREIDTEEGLVRADERGWSLAQRYARLATLEYYRGVVRNDGYMRGVEDADQKDDLGVLLQGSAARGLAEQIVFDDAEVAAYAIEEFRRDILDPYMAQYAIIHTLRGMTEISDAKGTFWAQCVRGSHADNKEFFAKRGRPDFGENSESRKQMYRLLSQSDFFMDSIRTLVDAIPDTIIFEAAKRLVVAEGKHQEAMNAWCSQYPTHEICTALQAMPASAIRLEGGGYSKGARPLTEEDIDAMQRDQASREASHRGRVREAQLGGKALRGGYGA